MQEYGRICVLGGDGRTSAMADRLCEWGFSVTAVAEVPFSDAVRVVTSCEEALTGARAVVLPIPAFDVDGGVVGCRTAPRARELFGLAGAALPVWGGRLSPCVRSLGEQMGTRLCDYMALEEVQLRNAIPTAEGAISIAMRELDVTLLGSRMAVLGYGRVGRALAMRLERLGVLVSVMARKQIDAARATCDGYRGICMNEEGLRGLCEGYDVIFNTVPARILKDGLLDQISRKTLLIELASCPGAWSPEQAAAQGHRVIYAPGLPGKYAPRSAGRLIADVIAPYLAAGEVVEG